MGKEQTMRQPTKKCYDCNHCEMCAWIKEVEEQGCEFFDNGNRWIPCSERLPEVIHNELIGDFGNSDPCIITYERHGCRWTAETTFVYCSDGLWRYCPNAEDEVYMPINDDCSIVAWMPLPEAMKEGEPNG